jgi:hypothetical protein
MEIYIYTICIISTYIGFAENFDNEYLDLRRESNDRTKRLRVS